MNNISLLSNQRQVLQKKRRTTNKRWPSPPLLHPGGHSQPLRDEAAPEQHLRGVVPPHHVPEAARHPEGAALDRVRAGEGAGLRGRGPRVVLPAVQGDVQPLLRPL